MTLGIPRSISDRITLRFNLRSLLTWLDTPEVTPETAEILAIGESSALLQRGEDNITFSLLTPLLREKLTLSQAADCLRNHSSIQVAYTHLHCKG